MISVPSGKGSPYGSFTLTESDSETDTDSMKSYCQWVLASLKILLVRNSLCLENEVCQSLHES